MKVKAILSVEKAARIMHKTPTFLRKGLVQNRFPFGSAVQNPKTGYWSYYIVPKKFYEYMGMEVPEDIQEKLE